MAKEETVMQRTDLLERTIMELGAEVYSLKSTTGKIQESQGQLLSILKGLKQLLDEKGLITTDDFDAAVELGAALEKFNMTHDNGVASDLERLKKTGH